MSISYAVEFLKKDPQLATIINRVGNYQVKITRNRYRALVEAIITQQLSGSAADSIIKKFKSLYNSSFPRPIAVIKTSDSKLRKTGLSKMKILYIKELSKKIESRELNIRAISKLSDEQVIEKLTMVKGIGIWTAEMFLIFSLGRLDVLPVGDLGLRKGIQQMFSLQEVPKADYIEKVAEKWKPYRTIATWYLWKSLNKFNTIG
jgi:DNA-3-methyladenine glycosylase II